MPRHLIRAAAAAFALALAIGTPAAAGGPTDPVGGEVKLGTVAGLRYIKESLVVGSSGQMDPPYEVASVSCGGYSSPWHPASGGSKVSGGSRANTIAIARPLDLDSAFESPDNAKPDDYWQAVVRSVLGRRLTGYAVCSKRSFRYVSVPAPNDASSSRNGTARCPNNRHLIGGGAFIATIDSYVNSSWPGQKNAWRTRIHDTAGGNGGMSTYAVCRFPGKVARVTKKKIAVAAGTATTLTARCPKGRHVISGGGRWTGSMDQAWLAKSLPVDGRDSDKIPDDGWSVTGYNTSGGTKNLTAVALCVTKG